MGHLVQREHPQNWGGIGVWSIGSAKNCNISETVQDGGTLNLREWTMREWTIRHHVAGMEFVGVDKSARCGKGGHCRSGQCVTMLQGRSMRERTMQEWSNACENVSHFQMCSRQVVSRRLCARIKTCINRYDSGAYTPMQFLDAISSQHGRPHRSVD